MTIYFVDEDIGGKSAYPIALTMRGHKVQTIPDASQALRQIPTAPDVGVVVIDVMLAPGLDANERFSLAQTRNGLETGLVLLELLLEANETIADKVILLSAATDEKLVERILLIRERFSVPFWKKGEFKSPSEFCGRLERHIHDVAPPPSN